MNKIEYGIDEDEENEVVEYRGPPLLPVKSNPSVPEEVWEQFQKLGVKATNHLERLLNDPRFANFTVKEQMSVINTTFNRAYGAVDGAVKKHVHVHGDLEDWKGYNALEGMSIKAKSLPEFRGKRSKDVDSLKTATDHNPLDADLSEDSAGNRDE